MTFKTLKDPAAWGVISALLALGWILGFGAAHRFWSQETAAWVQAVGSIAAVAGAYILGERQARHAQSLDKDRRDAEATAAKVEKGNLRHARAEYALAAAHRATAMVAVWMRELRVEKAAPEGRRLRHHRAAYQVLALDPYPMDLIPLSMLGYFVNLAGNLHSIIRVYHAETHTPSGSELDQLELVWTGSSDAFDNLRLMAITDCEVGASLWPPDWKTWDGPSHQ